MTRQLSPRWFRWYSTFPENRMSQTEVEDKFAQLIAGLIPDEQTILLIDAVNGLENLNNISDLISLLQEEGDSHKLCA